MPGIRAKHFIMNLALIVMGGALSSFTLSHSCNAQVIELKVPSPAKGAVLSETVYKGTTPQEIKRCFGDGVKITSKVIIYPLIRERSGKKRYCHIAFLENKDTGKMFIAFVAQSNYSEISCRMRALKCLRPEAYNRIKKKYNIDEN